MIVTAYNLTTLLLGDTDSSATATSGLGVLATDTETPVVAKTTVSADLLQALQIITQLGVDAVGQNLRVLAVDNVALSVEEPGGDLVLGRVLDNGDDSLKLFGGKFTGTIESTIISTLALPLVLLLSSLPPFFSRDEWRSLNRTACSGRHRPSCKPSWSIGDRHP